MGTYSLEDSNGGHWRQREGGAANEARYGKPWLWRICIQPDPRRGLLNEAEMGPLS